MAEGEDVTLIDAQAMGMSPTRSPTKKRTRSSKNLNEEDEENADGNRSASSRKLKLYSVGIDLKTAHKQNEMKKQQRGAQADSD